MAKFRFFASAILTIQCLGMAVFGLLPVLVFAHLSNIKTTSEYENQLKELATSPKWLRLMHYRKDWISKSGYKSEIDGLQYFFAKNGKWSPRAELKASIDALRANRGQIGPRKLKPQCAFPVRARWLKEQLGPDFELDSTCLELQTYHDQMDADGVSLVFSAAYPNNPGSMFGHTFLRIHSKKAAAGLQSPWLDKGLSFAAWVPPDHGRGVLYALGGLMGGYQGRFSVVQYHAKLAEYVNSHSRDVWEYRLTLTPTETEELIDHIWEIEMSSHFDYYFFDENCAYQLLTVLEAVRPDWQLSDHAVHLTPAGSAKKLMAQPGAVDKVQNAPSLRRQVMSRYFALGAADQKLVRQMLNHKEAPAASMSPDALMTLNQYLQYDRGQKDGFRDPKDQELFYRSTLALNRRSQSSSDSTSRLSVETPTNQPDVGHGAYRIGLAQGHLNSAGGFRDYQIRFAYHDWWNDDRGYEAFSQLEFPYVTLREYEDRLQVEQVNFANIASLFPLNFLERRQSWVFMSEYYHPKDFGCVSCGAIRLRSGTGGSLGFWQRRGMIFSMAEIYAEAGDALERDYRLGPNWHSGFLLNPVPAWKLGVIYQRLFKLAPVIADEYGLVELHQSWSFDQRWELRGMYQWWHQSAAGRDIRSGQLTLNYNFDL